MTFARLREVALWSSGNAGGYPARPRCFVTKTTTIQVCRPMCLVSCFTYSQRKKLRCSNLGRFLVSIVTQRFTLQNATSVIRKVQICPALHTDYLVSFGAASTQMITRVRYQRMNSKYRFCHFNLSSCNEMSDKPGTQMLVRGFRQELHDSSSSGTRISQYEPRTAQ
jgi:hypothetical protein